VGRARGTTQRKDREPGRSLMRLRAVVLVLTAIAGVVSLDACASQGMPPGGPPDVAAPTLVKVSPESGVVGVTPRVVEFQFDEVISERPRGAQSLEQIVVISPSDGTTEVDWARNRIVVRPGRGWRPNTAYTVTLLAGLSDLRSNTATQPFRTVFSTGNTIPTGVLRGVAFDWLAGRAAPGARIEATIGGDTLLKWSIAADSTGRFVLTSLPAATFLVRGWVDANGNGVRDTREAWDTTTVAISDSARVDFYAFPHDTAGARIAEASVVDSMTIRLRFDHGLIPGRPLADASIRVLSRDSTERAIVSVLAVEEHDSLARARTRAREDSVARSDTSAAGQARRASADSALRRRQADSVNNAQTAALRAARDTIKRDSLPRPARLTPPVEFVITMRDPLPVGVPVRVVAQNVQAIFGPPRNSERQVTRPRPVAADSTASRRPPVVPPARPPR
jgi:hypothetical protein